MRRIGAIAVLVSALSLSAAAQAGAETTTLDFDSLAVGTTVNTESGITFVGGPKVFDPVHVATITEPHALHTNGTCSGSTCPSGSDKLEMTFENPVGVVAMYVGLDDETAEAEFGDTARLVAYDAGGKVVGDTGNSINLGAGDYTPITHRIAVTSVASDIRKAVLIVGEGGTPRRVNVDNVEIDTTTASFFPPTAKIESPVNGTEFDRGDDLRVSGRVTAHAGRLRYCLTVSPAPPASFPADCNQHLAGESFKDVRVGPLVTGVNHITVWVEDTQLRQAHDTVDVVLKENDLRVTNMEVTQAVQKTLPRPGPDDEDSAHTAAYEGVPLIDDKSTVVRVWTSARLDAAGTPVHGAAVYLYGAKADGTPLPGGPIPAREGTRDIGPSLSFGPLIDERAWSNPASSWTFELPWAWQQTHGAITLRAVVNPPTAYPRVSECAACSANNSLSLTGVRFQRPHTLDLYPFRVFYTREGKFVAPPENPWPVFRETIEVSPFDINVHPWVGTLNAQSIADDKGLDGDGQTSAIYDRLTNAVDIMGYPGFFTLAVNIGLGPGVTSEHFSWHSFTNRTYSVVEANRPLTSVAHEIYHAIDYTHAGRSCDEAVQRGGAESWPPDDRGDLQSLGTDITPLFNPATRRLRLFGPFDEAGNPVENVDLMSYCINEGQGVWISALNWERAVGRVASATGSSAAPAARAGRPRIPAASAGGPNLGVSAEIGEGSGHILRVDPGRGRVNAPVAGSDVSFRVLDAGGRVVSDTPVAVEQSHVDLVGHGVDVAEISAVVPAAGAAAVELVKNGIVLDTVRRSAHAPAVKLLAPKRGTRLGSRGAVRVRWKARDRDAGRLLSTVEFSADGGRHWKALVVGQQGNSYPVPISYLSRSDNARIRVEVSDGWNRGRATSARFSVAGPPPKVTIESPPKRTRINAGDPLNLEGIAFDDRSRSLAGGRLHWHDGREPLGHGERITVSDLSPGKHTIGLEAIDRSGRRGRDSVTVSVAPVKPAFIVLEGPPSLSAKAHRMRIRAAASITGKMMVRGSLYPVGPRARRYSVRIRPGKAPLQLKLSLSAGGKRIVGRLTIPRK